MNTLEQKDKPSPDESVKYYIACFRYYKEFIGKITEDKVLKSIIIDYIINDLSEIELKQRLEQYAKREQ